MFGTSGIRGRVGTDVTVALAVSVGRALAADGAQSVVIGRDPRDSGALLADALAAGCRESGADVIRLGLAATPTVARAVGWRDADAGVSVTASHNPPPDNGFKLWTAAGQAFPPARQRAIADRVRSEDWALADWDGLGTETDWPGAADRHVAAITDGVTVDRPLSVVVDLGNGAGGVTVRALQALGCRVETLNAQPDGRFPGRPSEPTAETCSSLRRLVAATDADLGIAHDGDADRMLAVTEDGSWVPGDVLLALFGRQAAETGAGDRVAAPLNTSLAVDEALAAVGATVTRTPVGDVHVARAASEPGVVFGGEPSGAWIWPDETRCPDGPLAACRLADLVAEEGPLSALVEGVDAYPTRRESIETTAKQAAMDRIAVQCEERPDADFFNATTDVIRTLSVLK